jgi:hypothetical protein
MKNTIIKNFLMLIVLGVVLSGCSKKSEYHINPPKSTDFNYDSVVDLNSSDIELIKEYIPNVVKWYNSIDITKPQPFDFITKDIKATCFTLSKNEIYRTHVNNVISGINQTDEEEAMFKQIGAVNAIYEQISQIMMTNGLAYYYFLSDEEKIEVGEENTITINKDSWVELGDKIKEAIGFYYN